MELNKEAIAKEAALHKRFSENDVNNYWTARATAYANQYDGDFGFLLSIKRDYLDTGKSLTPGQVKGILNCARQEGEKLEFASQQAVTPLPVADEVPPVDFSISFDLDAFQEKADEAVKPPAVDSAELQELNAITARIVEIQTKLNDVKNLSDPLSTLIEQGKEQEKLAWMEFELAIAKIREDKQQAEAQFNALEVEMSKLQEDIEAQERLKILTLQNIAAKKLFEETKSQFDELRKGKVWDDRIMGFQWDDVCFMLAGFLSDKKGILNANDMGLGKTAESAFFIDILIPLFVQKYGRLPRILWLTKKTLRYSTLKEIRKWGDHQIVVLDGTPEARDFQLKIGVANNMMIIANYDQMNTTSLLDFDWDIVFMDEVHKLKGGANSKPTLIFENAVKLCKKAKFIVPLSGSPIQNHPKEMWCYLHLLDPDRFPNVRHFERNFCYGWGEKDENGNPIMQVDWEKIIRAMKDKVIRHSKAECLPDLPDKVREFRFVEREGQQEEIYQMLRTEFFVYLDENKEMKLNVTSLLAQLTRLRQANIIPASMRIKLEDGTFKNVDCYESAKIDECMELLEQLVGAGEQVVVFSSQFNEPLKEVQRRVVKELPGQRCEILSGENSANFQSIESDFQEGKIKVLCVNMKTGGEGLNLQKSDDWAGGSNNAIFLDLWWNPKFNEQAEDRLHRKGQKDAVTIHILQAENSVDQFIAAKLEEKEAMISGIMEDSSLRKGSEWIDLLRDLL